MTPILEPGDIFFARSSSWIARSIRFMEGLGEPSGETTECNHVGIVVAGGRIADAVIVEAQTKVQRVSLANTYGDAADDARLQFFRPLNLSAWEIRQIVNYAEAQEGKGYGYGKIALHAIDRGLSWLFGRNVVLFRRMSFVKTAPICSYLVAQAFATVDRTFGIDERCAQPEEMRDFCWENLDRYSMLFGGWVKITKSGAVVDAPIYVEEKR